jgi:hypothetical protein
MPPVIGSLSRTLSGVVTTQAVGVHVWRGAPGATHNASAQSMFTDCAMMSDKARRGEESLCGES